MDNNAGPSTSNKSTVSTIVILDRSISMGDSFKRLLNEILPLVFQKLEYACDDIIHLITFDSIAEEIDARIDFLSRLNIEVRGFSLMCTAVKMLDDFRQRALPNYCKGIRLLTITNGKLQNQEKTRILACDLATRIRHIYKINSQAVQLLVYENDALNENDTQGLSSILQMNNVNTPRILDLAVTLNNEDMATAISNVFVDDDLVNLQSNILDIRAIYFNKIVRQEVRAMSEHLDELIEVSDRDHEVSFYSRETTLGGIRAICKLVKKNLLDDLDANDILLMLNIVGVACSGPIGKFPNPISWKINELYLGCNCSLSDVLTASRYGRSLKNPGTEKEITNVIPIFDDNRIIFFLRKYAPSLLEYTCSIGMRGSITDVPMTCGYTMCAAVWRMIEDLNFEKSELHLKTFERFVLNYEFFVGRYFEHILPYIKDQQQKHNSYYIANNGITNMISPLITIIRLNDDKLQYMPNILRALYSYEIWQATRRLYENENNSDMIIKDILSKLLGIDIDKNKTPVTPLFVNESDIKKIKFYDEPLLNEAYLSELVKNFDYLKYATLMPKYFNAVVTGNTNSIINIPAVTDETICEALKIDYDLKTFHFYNIIQALLFTTNESRIDTDKEIMKIPDLIDKREGEEMVKNYIRKQFENEYISDLAAIRLQSTKFFS